MRLSKHPLQSPEWMSFRKKWGNEILKTQYGYLTLHKIPLTPYKIGMFIKGPKPTSLMLEYLKTLAKEKKLIFIKLEPHFVPLSGTARGAAQFAKALSLLKERCLPGKTLFTPTTFWIDLAKSEDELLKSFTPKTRYNIRLAQKHGVEVVEDNSDKAFEEYLKLTRETVERQGFYAHTERYHRLMWETLRPAGIAHLLVARYKEEITTTWILFAYDGVLYYPYGASTEKHKNVMANNLMMWEAIKLGKKLGCRTFDLWGREPGKGFTKFKEGYNPEVVEFLGTWDLVINWPLYYIYRLLENIRWMMLRLKSKITKPTF